MITKKGYEGTFKANVEDFKKVLDCFPKKAPIVVNGSVDVLLEKLDEDSSFGCAIIPAYNSTSELFSIGEILGNTPRKNNLSLGYNPFKPNDKATVGELIEQLNGIPSECKIMFDNIIIENTNGALDGRFETPCGKASLEYVLNNESRWGFEFNYLCGKKQ